MHFISFSCFAFFYSLCVHGILLSCFSCSLFSLFPLCQFLSVSGQVFWLSMPFNNCVKNGENFANWMSFLKERIDLGGELHVKGKKFFYLTNLGGELVWYTLILIYFVLCIFWFCNHLHTSCVISIYNDDECVSLFISHVLFLFTLYTHVSSLNNLFYISHMVPWYVLFSAFQEGQVKAKSRLLAFFL